MDKVFGLNANGDGFLAVRSGPGTQYRKQDELHNGDEVLVYDNRGNWAGIACQYARAIDDSLTRLGALLREPASIGELLLGT